MPRRPKIKITCIDRLGKCPCHRGHRIGDSWDFDKDRGQICPHGDACGVPLYRYPALWRRNSSAWAEKRDSPILLPRRGNY